MQNPLSQSKILDLISAIDQRNKWKSDKNERVVFTNGCFDILHLGHVDYLEKSSLSGTKLIVAVNSDRSVKDYSTTGIIQKLKN